MVGYLHSYITKIDKFIRMYYCSGMNYEALPKEVLQEVLLLEQQHKRLETREVAQTKFLAVSEPASQPYHSTHHITRRDTSHD